MSNTQIALWENGGLLIAKSCGTYCYHCVLKIYLPIKMAQNVKLLFTFGRCLLLGKETTKQHPLLGNRYVISRYTQPLLGNTFANGNVPAEKIGATTEELCFLLVLAEGLSMGQVWKLAVRESVDRRLGRFS
jgi:hypothetical protein